MSITDPLPLLRSSERSTFMRCPQKWYWGYVEGLKPIAEKKVLADFGSLVHICMAEFYKPGTVRGPLPVETWDVVAKEQINTVKVTDYNDGGEMVATWEDFYELGIELMEAYHERYQGDPHWDIIDAERRFAVTIPDVRYPAQEGEDGRKGFRPICTLVGTLDLVFRDLNDGLVKMLDHKTAGRIETNHLSLDPQASTYMAIGTHTLREQGLIGPKEVVKGMEYNFIKRAKVDRRPRDEMGRARNKPTKQHYCDAILSSKWSAQYDTKQLMKMSKDDLAFEAECTLGLTVLGEVSADQSSSNFFRIFVPRSAKERQNQIVRISNEAATMARIVAGDIPVLKNTTKDCYWCEYFDLCELDEAGEDTSYFKETVYKNVDPYFDHRPNAVNSKKVTDGS